MMALVQTQEVFSKYTDDGHPQVEIVREFTLPPYLSTTMLPRVDPPDWNYTKNGADWNFNYCKLPVFPQSPIDITWTNVTDNSTKAQLNTYDWHAYYFSFIPRFREVMIDTMGISNFTMKLTLKDDTKGFHGFWAAEPLNWGYERLDIVNWAVTEIRFKYPAEHTFNGSRHDLEMQIYTKDANGTSIVCKSHTAALSVFFDLNSTNPNNNFFGFLTQGEQKYLDLSKVVDFGASMKGAITGY